MELVIEQRPFLSKMVVVEVVFVPVFTPAIEDALHSQI